MKVVTFKILKVMDSIFSSYILFICLVMIGALNIASTTSGAKLEPQLLDLLGKVTQFAISVFPVLMSLNIGCAIGLAILSNTPKAKKMIGLSIFICYFAVYMIACTFLFDKIVTILGIDSGNALFFGQLLAYGIVDLLFEFIKHALGVDNLKVDLEGKISSNVDETKQMLQKYDDAHANIEYIKETPEFKEMQAKMKEATELMTQNVKKGELSEQTEKENAVLLRSMTKLSSELNQAVEANTNLLQENDRLKAKIQEMTEEKLKEVKDTSDELMKNKDVAYEAKVALERADKTIESLTSDVEHYKGFEKYKEMYEKAKVRIEQLETEVSILKRSAAMSTVVDDEDEDLSLG